MLYYAHCIIYMMIIITRSLSRWHSFGFWQHKQRLNDLGTQLGWWNSYYYYISANEAKTQEEELMQQWTITNNENEPRRAA